MFGPFGCLEPMEPVVVLEVFLIAFQIYIASVLKGLKLAVGLKSRQKTYFKSVKMT